MTKLMRYHIGTLRLRDDAPFPSQVTSAHEFIRRWRHDQRLRVVRGCGDSAGSRDSDVADDNSDMAEGEVKWR